MKKRYKIGLVFIILLILGCIFIGGYKYLKSSDKKPNNTTSVISKIDDYGYNLDDRDTRYMKEEFDNLRNILQQEELNYEEYAKSLAKLFIIDFYTLNNKINKYDVGSVEYIYKDKQEDFRNKASDTIYNDIIDNTYLDRVQDLPEISEVIIDNLEEINEKIDEKEYEGYKISLSFSYKKDLGYDNKGIVYIIKNENKLEIIKYEAIS